MHLRQKSSGRRQYERRDPGGGIGVAVYVDDLTHEGLTRLLDDVPSGTPVEIYSTVSAGRHYARRWEWAGVVRDSSPALACIQPAPSAPSSATSLLPRGESGAHSWWIFTDFDRLDSEGRRTLREFLSVPTAAGDDICWVAARDQSVSTMRELSAASLASLRAEIGG